MENLEQIMPSPAKETAQKEILKEITEIKNVMILLAGVVHDLSSKLVNDHASHDIGPEAKEEQHHFRVYRTSNQFPHEGIEASFPMHHKSQQSPEN